MVDKVIQEHCAQSCRLWETDQYSVARPNGPRFAEHVVTGFGQRRVELSSSRVEERKELGC